MVITNPTEYFGERYGKPNKLPLIHPSTLCLISSLGKHLSTRR